MLLTERRNFYSLNLKEQADPTRFYLVRNIFNEEELNYLSGIAKSANNHAVIGGHNKNQRLDKNIRVTRVNWIGPEKDYLWLYNRLAKNIERINEEFFNFELSHISPLQLGNYKAEESGKYDWHMDCGHGTIRKLSIALQLNNPNEYEGGEFSFMRGVEEEIIPKEKGLMVLFPSFLLHRVSPVTSGERQSLVCWINGNRPFS
jgi:PKHD-type hydroxylase